MADWVTSDITKCTSETHSLSIHVTKFHSFGARILIWWRLAYTMCILFGHKWAFSKYNFHSNRLASSDLPSLNVLLGIAAADKEMWFQIEKLLFVFWLLHASCRLHAANARVNRFSDIYLSCSCSMFRSYIPANVIEWRMKVKVKQQQQTPIKPFARTNPPKQNKMNK